MMPMPPSQWVRLRHMRIPRGTRSISVRTEAPVVVKPETDSKKASTNELNVSENRKGKAPTTPAPIQPRATIAIPSR